jgi:signal transduction histidine kinase
MVETRWKLKSIFFIDAIIFLICVAGTISVYQKAKLPFDLKSQGSQFSIQISNQNPYNLSTGDILLSVNGLKINSSEKAEVVTDRNIIGDEVSISVLSNQVVKNLNVKLTRFYSTFYLISISVVSLFFFIIAIFVLIKKFEMKVAHLFHWTSIGIAAMMCLTWSNMNTFSTTFMILIRVVQHFAYVLVPALFVNFTLLFPRDNSIKWKKFLYLNYLIALLLGITINYLFIYSLYDFNDQAIDNFLLSFVFIRLYLIICVIISISFFIVAFIREKNKAERQQLKWVLFGFIIGPLSFVFLWVIPILITGYAIIPEEMIMILLCAIPITFAIAIIKYHLLDIDEVLNRGIVYGIVLAIMIIIYTASLGVLISYFKISDEAHISVIAAIGIALLFTPLKNKVQDFVDKKFFRIQYDFRVELNKFITDIKNFNSIHSLGNYLVEEIDKLMPVDKIGFCELDTSSGKLRISSQNNFDKIADKTLQIKRETLERKWFEVGALKNKADSDANVSMLYQNTLKRWQISLVVPIKSVKNELYGFIILGNKKSGSKFTVEDVDLLRDIGVNAGSTIERIILQEKLIREQLAAERLTELNNQKSLFVSTVSHDLKTPLTSIKIFSEMLRDKENNLTENSKRHLEIIEGEADRLTRLINNVLDFSKIEKGVKEYSFREVHLNSIVRKVIELMGYTLNIKGFRLETSITDFNDKICGDEDAILEAIENLITNGIRFSIDDKQIRIITFHKNNFACVRVEDKGIGIEQSDIDKIFTPYYRSTNAKKTSIDGTGLGLQIVKHIIDSHKGNISVESVIGEGSAFTLCFPQLISDNQGVKDEKVINN